MDIVAVLGACHHWWALSLLVSGGHLLLLVHGGHLLLLVHGGHLSPLVHGGVGHLSPLVYGGGGSSLLFSSGVVLFMVC